MKQNSRLIKSTEKRLRDVLEGLPIRNLFQLFGITTKSSNKELKKGYLKLAEMFQPDKYKDMSPQVKALADKIMIYLNESYLKLKDQTKRKTYSAALEIGTQEEIERATVTFNRGTQYMYEGRFHNARKTFEGLVKMRCAPAETMVHYIWAILREYEGALDKRQLGRIMK